MTAPGGRAPRAVLADGDPDGARCAPYADGVAAGDTATVPVLLLGGSGYVAGELLRLLAAHPRLRAASVISESRAGDSVDRVFPHLAGCFPGLALSGRDALSRVVGEHERLAVFCTAPHGAAAPVVDALMGAAARSGCDLALVDVSSDFRFRDAARWEQVYGHPHGAPGRLAEFGRGVPELVDGVPARAIAHPGCFTTATLLAAVPLARAGLVAPEVTVVATTGSTGAGRTPTASTHHPERRSNLYAYSPLAHRHQPEMEALAAEAGAPLRIGFVPQSGPFARGIYATLVMRPRRGADAAAARAALAAAYAGSPFVSVGEEPPRLQEVVGSNRCRLGVAADRGTLVVFSALDNLTKGAAGGAVQWMNRLLGYEESAGLLQPGIAWL